MELITKIFGEKARIVKSYEKVDIDNPHGIYLYDKNSSKWLYIDPGTEYFKPRMDGIYVVYFDNTRCPACRVYDIHWFPYVTLIGSNLENVYFVIVLCEWFARNCRSSIASNTFKHYDIHASPTTLLLYVKNGEIADQEKVEGVKTMDKLASIVEEFARKNGVQI
ncbi:MAG: hypothetical protein ABWW65_02820 [Thermoprotei archaeon]